MTSQKNPAPWSVEEVEEVRSVEEEVEEVRTLLSLVADVRIQRKLDGATRNQNIHQEVAQRMATRGYRRTPPQCREKLKKMKSRKRKRSLFQQDLGAVLRVHADDVAQQEQNRAQRERHTQLLLADAREERELEASLRREANAQTAAFNQTFLGLLGQLVQAMSDRRPITRADRPTRICMRLL
ncbi:Zinc finger protein with KRAB and SCAN domains 2 [Merluccius polli]|uniref:Zinc finger protein with KRAB and SCAN domains 2 n=1 Tax=Merluccius polli TaxID=89951 RepID=A0AA47N9X6_MERPO|nr:Zinc finger protein with KRAB and SCAN domains 2 [Merluccius polli]